MAELTNSQRRLNKATYVPLRVAKEGVAPAGPGGNPPPTMRVLDKLSLLRSLQILKPELDVLKQGQWAGKRLQLAPPPAPPAPGGADIAFLDVVGILVSDASPATMAQYAPLLAQVTTDELLAFGEALKQLRQQIAVDITTRVDALRHGFTSAQARVQAARPVQRPLEVRRPSTTAGKGSSSRQLLAKAISKQTQLLLDQAALSATRPSSAVALPDLLQWGQQTKSSNFAQVAQLAQERVTANVGESVNLLDVAAWLNGASLQVKCTTDVLNGFKERFKVEPVGRLHLERIEMTPVGIEHGELVHSVPLTPKETVNISHREWSVRAEEFDQIVQDVMEGYSEQGVVEKSELTRSTESQSKHDSQLDVNGSVSAHYDGGSFQITASAAVDYKTQATDQQASKDSTHHAVDVSRKAASRSKRDHKTSFKVSSVAGAEDLAVRVLTNPSDTNAMRVDYFQLMRKWRVDLMRYGLRLTYDIVIPNPGADLTRKVLELRKVNDLLLTDTPFPLSLVDLTRDNWQNLAATYGAAVDPPPDEIKYESFHREFVKYDKDHGFESFDLDVDTRYQVNTAFFYFDSDAAAGGATSTVRDYLTGAAVWPGGFAYFQENDGKSGRMSYGYEINGLKDHNGAVELAMIYTLRDVARSDWQLKAWTGMQQAWDDRQLRDRQLLRDRKAQLLEEINQYDALTLRMMEREEIMKGVLRWIFGPDFDFDPFHIQSLYAKDQLSPDQVVLQPICGQDGWERVMDFGEFIKYIHSAIEWENVIYLPYPYFWDHPANHDFKRFLWHPDAIHRVFLRSGAARVVLTIREGFEESFTKLVETGAFGKLSTDHPYVSIGEEIHNFAKTNYPGIPPANPDKNVRPLIYPEQRKAWDEIQQLARLLDAFFAANNRYPTTAEWLANPHPLAALVPLRDGAGNIVVDETGKAVVGTLPINDPWGRQYVYRCPGLHGDFDLASYGSDGQPNTNNVQLEDPKMTADITNWAEGSLIATWFEYTPTSALDVAINVVLPTSPQPA